VELLLEKIKERKGLTLKEKCRSHDVVSQVAVMIMIVFEGQRNYKDSKLLCYGTVVYRAGQDTETARGQGRQGSLQQDEGNQPSDLFILLQNGFSILGNRGTVLGTRMVAGKSALAEKRGVR
jgi:hypothetical protein